MDAIVVAIGDEVVAGQTINTNGAVIARALTEWGFNVQMQVGFKDDLDQLEIGLPALLAQTNLLVLCGGLGPTTDDKTRDGLTQAFDWQMIQDDSWMNILVKRYDKPESILKSQAIKPIDSITLFNKEGTACGFLKEAKKDKWVAVLPGVPQECGAMLEELHLQLKELTILQSVEERIVLHFIGVYERYLEYYLKKSQKEHELKNLFWGLYPGMGVVQVVLKGPLFEQKIAANILRSKYSFKEYSGNLLEDFVEILSKKDEKIFIIETITAGWIQYYLSRQPHLKKFFFFQGPLRDECSWFLESIQLDDLNFKIMITKNKDIFFEYSLRIAGSIEIQQQKLSMATLGVLYEFLKNESFQLVAEPSGE